jgi:8-oxo-dGTP diphosphatase
MTSVYLRYQDKILLLYRQGSRVANDVWISSAGGHIEENEINDAQACVLRELKEKLCLDKEDLKNFQHRYVTLRKTNGEIRVIYYYFADLEEELQIESDEGLLKWFPLSDISPLPMPLTAKKVLQHYVDEGQFDSHLYSGSMSGREFYAVEWK